MTNVNITSFRKNVFDYVSQAVDFNEVVNISTKNGNAIIISEADYKALMETLHICSVRGLSEQITEAGKTPLDECIPEDGVIW